MRIQYTLLVTALAACGGEEMFKPELGGSEKLLAQAASAKLGIGNQDQTLLDAVVVGDLDGDGLADTVMRFGYVVDNPQGALIAIVSRVYVVYGGTEVTGDIDLTTLATLEDVGSVDSTITALGDVDGDGLADVLVGVPFTPGCGNIPNPASPRNGGVYLVYGSTTRLAGTQSISTVGAFLRDSTVCTTADHATALGDVDGDGHADFAVGRFDITPVQTGAQVLVFYGRSQRLTGTLDLVATADAELHPNAASPAVDVLGVGDVDGDGHPDFVVNFDRDASLTSLVRGGPARLAGSHALADVASTQLPADAAIGGALGDLDGDGIADFYLELPQTYVGFPDRKYHLYYGRAGGFGPVLGAADATIDGGWEGFTFAAADLDGDGHRDLVIGDPLSHDRNGAVRILAGSTTRLSGAIDNDAPAIHYVGAPQHATNCDFSEDNCIMREWVGSTLSIGDVTGDGRPDLMIGASANLGLATLGFHGVDMARIYLLSPQ